MLLHIIASTVFVILMSACSGGGGDGYGGVLNAGAGAGTGVGTGVGTGGGGGAGSHFKLCIDLNNLKSTSTIVAKSDEFYFSIALSDKANLQHGVSGEVIWQSVYYSYAINGQNISFTRTQDSVARTAEESLSQPGAVIPETISITFDNHIITKGVKFTYDGLEYTVASAFDENLTSSCE
jgi:hypothetical protein